MSKKSRPRRQISFTALIFLGLSTTPLRAAERCQLWSDPQGIPHVRAENDPGAYYCMGYLHGRDRAWQMDFLRRVSEGRASEVVGKESLKLDYLMRLLGLAQRAAGIYSQMSVEARARFEAYAEGANRGMAEALKKGVYEFQDLGYQPETWKPEHSIALVLLQSFDNTRKTFEEKRRQAEDVSRLGKPAQAWSAEEGLPWDTAILKKGEYEADTQTAARASASVSRALGPLFSAETFAPLERTGIEAGIGSNNWVVAPARSASGKAWLANDPHLSLRYPSFWHWSNISGPGWDAIGAAVPGVPAIVSGANRHAAWGLTNSYMDVTELFYVPEAELKDAESFRPWIWVKVWKLKLPVFFKKLQRTREGWPVLPLPGPEGKALVLRWSGFETGPADFERLAGLMRATSTAEIDGVLRGIRIPSWNFVFADTQGKIGYRAIGAVPRQRSEQADALYGVTERHLSDAKPWAFRTPEEMPHLMQPPRGYIATANNRQWPADALDYAGRAHARGFRAFRIEELLLKTRRHDLESMQKIQCDVQAVDARHLLPLLLKGLRERFSAEFSKFEKEMIALFEEWAAQEDYQVRLDCKACLPYRLWMESLLAEDDWNEATIYRALTLQPPATAQDRERLLVQANAKLLPVMERILREPGSGLPEWREAHHAPFRHLGADGGLSSGLWISTPGDEHTVNPGTATWPDPSDSKGGIQKSGASQRLVVELASPPVIHLSRPGMNEDVKNPSATAWEKWARCEYEPVAFPVEWAGLPREQVISLP